MMMVVTCSETQLLEVWVYPVCQDRVGAKANWDQVVEGLAKQSLAWRKKQSLECATPLKMDAGEMAFRSLRAA